MEHHPKLSLRSADAPSCVRANAVMKENMEHYFTLLRQILVDNDLLDNPAYIYNMDETGMPLDHKQLWECCRTNATSYGYNEG